MPVDPNADTHSPWYECFEPHAPAAAPTAQPAAAASAPTIGPTTADDTDGAAEALFDYYNA